MIARSEHKLRQQSRPPVIDFDMRGQDHEPERASKRIGKLFRWAGNTIASLIKGISHERDTGGEIPLSNADQPCQ
jgi:hypothetical protein